MLNIFSFIFVFLFSSCLDSKNFSFDVSRNLIHLDKNFEPTFNIFGYNNFNNEIFLKIKGPTQSVILQKKKKIFNIWTWKRSGKFTFPSLFHFYTNKLSQTSEFKIKKQMFDEIKVFGKDNDNLKRDLIENKMKSQLFLIKNDAFEDVDKNIKGFFKIPVNIPFNANPGKYVISLETLNSKEILKKEKIIFIKKPGINSFIYKFAHQLSLLYGLFCAIIAISLGLAAGYFFRRI